MAPRGANYAAEAPAADEGKWTPLKKIRIGTVEEAPAYAKLPILRTGYRLNYGYWDATNSIFQWHLDTINVWTHLVGFLYFVWAMKKTYDALALENAGWVDYALFTFFLIGAQYQMLGSAVYHTFRCVDYDTDAFLLRVDLGGIAAMIVGSYTLGMTQAFVCSPVWSAIYLTCLLCILAAVGVMASWPDFQTPEWDFLRNLVMGGAVGFSLIPVGHWLWHCDWKCTDIVISSYGSMMGLYFVGYLVFMTRFPECLFPGRFDTIGASHQIWHIFVWAAGAAWLEGMLSYRQWRNVHHAHCLTPAWWGDLTAPFETFDVS